MGPTTLQLFANSKCNLACWFCNTRDRRREKPQPDVSPEQAARVLEAFPTIRKVWVGGTGEPLMHPTLPRVLDAIHDHGVRMHVTTNGTRVLERPDMPWSLVETVTVSLLEASKERHERATGTKLFKNAIGGIELLVDNVGYVELACIVTRDNVEELPFFLALARRLGVAGVNFRNISRCAGDDPARFIRDTALHAGVDGLVERLRAVKAQAPKGMKIQWPRVTDFDRPRQKLCWTLEHMLVVDGAGNVSCCCRGRGPLPELGNIAEAPEVWSGSGLEEFRRQVRGPEAARPAECRCCFVPYEEVAL